MGIAIVTSCPNGIVGSYLAAQKLMSAAKELGIKAVSEAQLQVADYAALSAEQIEQAELILLVGSISRSYPALMASSAIGGPWRRRCNSQLNC